LSEHEEIIQAQRKSVKGRGQETVGGQSCAEKKLFKFHGVGLLKRGPRNWIYDREFREDIRGKLIAGDADGRGSS